MIRLLIGENPPATLAANLTVPCMHATEVDERPTDDALWSHAKKEDLTILTKDVDFFNRLALEGAPPKVIWLRTGNLRRRDQDELLAGRMAQIIGLLEQADLVQVHEDRLESFSFR